jgi:manganese transport system ATP-binding protein
VLMHSTPDEILKPANLARAFGLDVLERGDAE